MVSIPFKQEDRSEGSYPFEARDTPEEEAVELSGVLKAVQGREGATSTI